jgi:hypothetical protein
MKMKLEKLTATICHSQDMFLRSFGFHVLNEKYFTNNRGNREVKQSCNRLLHFGYYSQTFMMVYLY